MAKSNKPKANPQPAEEQSWEQEPLPIPANEGVAEMEQDAKWDGSNEVSPMEEPEPTADDWNSVPAPLTLNIQQHSGQFNPEQAKLLIYGETGTQKTRTASTFPGVIFADIDHGMSSVTEQVDNVFIEDSIEGFKQLKDLYSFLKAGNHSYETVVLDTLNEMQRVIMRFTIEEFTTVRRSYGTLPGQSDYGFMLNQFMELTRDFINLPMRVVLLAQVNSRVFDTDMLMPQLIGKNTAREILRKMDIVGYIYRTEGEGDHKLPAMSFDSIECVTKDRSNRLPANLTNPTYSRMAAYWK